MDFLESLQSKFQKYHKKNNIIEHRKTRLEELRLTRIQLRSKNMDIRRPLEQVKTPKQETPRLDRRAKLLIWKQERKNKLEESKKEKKPIFVLGSATNLGFPGLNANSKSFGPKNHVFKPPSNVKPIPLRQVKNPQIQRVTRSQKPVASPPLELPRPTRKKRGPTQKKDNVPQKILNVIKYEDPESKPTEKRRLRKICKSDEKDNKTMQNQDQKPKRKSTEKRLKSLRRSIFKSDSEESQILTEKENSPMKNEDMEVEKPKRKSTGKRRNSLRRSLFKSESEESQILTDKENTPLRNNQNTQIEKSNRKSTGKRRKSLRKSMEKSSETENTPKNNGVYVSPFVTTSRGKGSVRKENLDRSLRGLPAFSDRKSLSKSGVTYFTNVLNNEVDRLEDLCRVWTENKNEDGLNEDAKDLIDVAVGQATLLMNKKFKQFAGLIKSCETGVGQEKEVTCDDLQGFWDMIYMQVENLNARFNRLTTMRNNNWEEIEPAVKIKVVKKRAPAKTAKPAASSGIRAAILAARKKKLEVNPPTSEESVFNGGFFVIKTPQKNTPNKRTPKTPKSILKSNKKKLVPNLNKSVLFKEEEFDSE